MFKALGAFVFGSVAVLGLGYLAIKKSGDEQSIKMLDRIPNKLASVAKSKASSFGSFIRSIMQDKQPIVLEENAA